MKTLVPVEEYLRTPYGPDCDYVDGEVLERNVGERDHSKLQGEFFYVSFGVPNVWVVDGRSRRASTYGVEGRREATDGILQTQSPAFDVPLSEIFAGLRLTEHRDDPIET